MQGKSRVRPGREQAACSQDFSVPSVQLGASFTSLRTPEYLQSRAGPLRLARLHSSPCMTPDKHRNTEQHGPGEFKLLIKLNYSWKQFFFFFVSLLRQLARARALHLQVLIARLSSWSRAIGAPGAKESAQPHVPISAHGQLSHLSPPERPKPCWRRKAKPAGRRKRAGGGRRTSPLRLEL